MKGSLQLKPCSIILNNTKDVDDKSSFMKIPLETIFVRPKACLIWMKIYITKRDIEIVVSSLFFLFFDLTNKV